MLADFVARTPATTSFLFTCRHDVDLGLKRARLYGELCEVRSRDLAFTEEEAAELFAHAGVELEPSHVSAFVELTDGWAAGLRFAALSAKGRDDLDRFVARFGHSDAVVAEFLVDEVLDRSAPSSASSCSSPHSRTASAPISRTR